MDQAKPSNRRRNIILIVIVLAAAAAIGWYYFSRARAASQALTASGTVEATQVQIASELSGRVAEIMVNEGDSFKKGDPLFSLDGELLKTQQEQAQAALQAGKDNLANAQAGVDAATTALDQAQVTSEVAKANAQSQLIIAQQKLDNLYKNADVAKSQAQQAVATATRAARDAQYQLDNYSVPNYQQNMTAVEAIVAMKVILDKARAAFEPYKYEDSGNQTRKDLKEALDNAQSDYDAAVRRQELESILQQAQANLAKAQQDLQDLQNGPRAEDVAILKAQIAALELAPKQADVSMAQAKTAVEQAQSRLAQAKSAVSQAQAALDQTNVQVNKLVVYALAPGVVLSRGVEPGEVIQAGSPVMSVGRLDNLTLTVYVPEDRYGEVKLGMPARVTVDSFPGKVFEGTVTYISDQAEYTPRNVQTVEGRASTVYAIKLAIANPDQSLKPGMPADVVLGQK